MEPNKDQPKADVKKNVASLAKAGRLSIFDDLSIIGEYGHKFGQDPDWVYNNTPFSTIAEFSRMWKEQSEYQERFQYIWHEIHSTPTKK